MDHDRPNPPDRPDPPGRTPKCCAGEPRPREASSPGPDARGVSRRSFMQTLGVSSAAAAISGAAFPARGDEQTEADGSARIIGPGPVDVAIRVNGTPMRASVEPSTTLLEMLRLNLNLTGTKEICDRGSCGGCSVMLNGTLVCSCMTLATDAHGANVTTVEGIARGDTLDRVQESFIRHDGFQCGYCTPGFIVAARALLDEKPKPSLDEIKCGLSGNYCRCAAYCNMYNAVLEASGQAPLRDEGGR